MPRRNRRQDGRPGSGHRGGPRQRPPDRQTDDDSDRRTPGRLVRHRGGRPPVAEPAPPLSWSAVELPRACGNCREWFADEVGGRGTCDHPGSGFLKPWSDTPACPFFSPR